MENEDEIKCPMETTISLINKKWVIQIIRDMFFGKSHFNEFKEDKPKLSNKVLSNCLKNMELDGLIKRVVDDEDASNIEYHLTDKGKSLNKVVYELAMFTLNSNDNNYDDKTREKLRQSFEEILFI